MILSLLNQNKQPIGELDQMDNCYITELLETGEDTLSFEIYVKHPLYKDLIEENLIQTDDNRYVIKSIDERGKPPSLGAVWIYRTLWWQAIICFYLKISH